jgi:hypothetical protein
MIYHAADKNNDHLNRRLMGQFSQFLNDVALKELHLSGRLYTWSNERSHPTLERIDQAFMLNKWEEIFPWSNLQALATICTDHARSSSAHTLILSTKKVRVLVVLDAL